MNTLDLTSSRLWRDLASFVTRFYERPLGPGDGNTEEELSATAADWGAPLPVALREWYQLAGKRLQFVQDEAVRLEKLKAHTPGLLTVWRENQGCWRIDTPLEGDDPRVRIEGGRTQTSPRLSEMLTGMVVSETLVGAWCGRGEGGLGRLSSEVVGGYFSDGLPEADLAKLRESFAPLAWAQNPFYMLPYLGDEELVLRESTPFVEWMACSTEAVARLDAVVALEPAGGDYKLYVILTGLEPTQLAFFTDGARGYPDTSKLQAALGKAGHVGRLGAGKRGVDAKITTKDPRAAWQIVANALPEGALAHAAAAFAPAAMTRFTVLHPEGLTRFVLPR